jgi:hypothetical protein
VLFGDSTGISVMDTQTKEVRLIIPTGKGLAALSFAVTGNGDMLYVVFDHTESDLWRLITVAQRAASARCSSSALGLALCARL